MNGFVLAGVAIAAFAAGAALVSFRYERELRRMARFLDQREPTGNARMTAFVRTRGVLGIARGVNAELDELQNERIASQQARQAFQAGLTCLSHDIRTPLAGAQGYLQLVEDEADPAAKERYLSAAAHRLDDEPVRPADVLGDVLAGLYPQFRERGWEPRVLLDDEAVVQADAEALARIFRNLTANALRHGAAAPVIEQRGGCVTFANLVADPAAIDIDRLFERFYQGGGARSSAGAGLAIVSQLSAALGATVAASLEGGVLRVTVELQ